MSLASRLRSSRLRRGLAASAVVLAAGGLVLFRSSDSARAAFTGDHGTSAATVGNASSFAGRGAHGTVALSHTKVPAGRAERVVAEVHLTADRVANEESVHAPLSMVVVLDTSGSMSGEKLEQAKNAVVRLVDDMAPTDEIALVRYSDEAETIQELARVQDVRSDLVSRVKGLQAGGGTAIPRGLSQGLRQLDGARSGRVRRIVLVSDGLDSTRVEAERLAATGSESGITVSSLGIGLDFDEAYMGSVARAGHGNFGFVKDASALASFLHRELTETATTTIENATVELDLPAGVTFARASGAQARILGTSSGDRSEGLAADDGRPRAASGQRVELRLGALFAGDERRVVVELDASVPSGDLAAVRGTASWSLIAGDKRVDVELSKLTLAGTTDMTAVEQGKDFGVLASTTSVLASEREVAATEAYARGDTATASSMIDRNIEELRRARASAPADARPMLDKQLSAYGATKSGFSAAAPSSVAGKTAAKRAVETDLNNLHKNAF